MKQAAQQKAATFTPPPAIVRSDWSQAQRDDRRLENMVFFADPFQAKTLPVFESIYRYGRRVS